MADARKDKRTLLSLKIRYKSATLEDFIERYSGDISRGGVFIKSKKPLDVGTLLKFEFLLKDQSSLIHGVGRVVWRRDPADADGGSSAGMGIKFIKMDPDSRSLVQRIVEGRDAPGVFERGGSQAGIAAQASDGAATPVPDDHTKVRHVSEFLASAFEEGGASEAATREAKAGAQRARQVSRDMGANRGAVARGALGGGNEVPTAKRQAVPEASTRSAASAFGGAGGSVSQAMAAPLEEMDAADDFLDDEATRVHDYPDAGATVVAGAGAAPFLPGAPEAPAELEKPSASRLETEVPDLFGPDMASSFGPSGNLEPAPGEFLDSSLLDPAVPTVPPPAGLPQGPGIPVEAFKPPTERAPANPYAGEDSTPQVRPTKGGPRIISRAVLWVLALVIVAASGIAGWQFGVVDQLKELAAPYLGDEIEVIEEGSVPTPVAPPPEAQAEADPVEAPAEAELEGTAAQAEQTDTTDSTSAAATGLTKVVVRSRPARAFLSVDGKPMGRTPATLHLKPGAEVRMVAKARGYLAKAQQVTVEPGSSTVTIALPTLPYFVEIQSTPSGARAAVDGGVEITTPGEMRFKAMINPVAITVSKDGFEPATKTISRREFREETKRMVTTVRVNLLPEGPEPSEAAEAELEEPSLEEEAPADDVAPEDAPEPQEPVAADEPTETTDADSF